MTWLCRAQRRGDTSWQEDEPVSPTLAGYGGSRLGYSGLCSAKPSHPKP